MWKDKKKRLINGDFFTFCTFCKLMLICSPLSQLISFISVLVSCLFLLNCNSDQYLIYIYFIESRIKYSQLPNFRINTNRVITDQEYNTKKKAILGCLIFLFKSS